MPKIFLSYRRNDSSQVSHLIYDSLVERFTRNSVFIDDEDIPVATFFPPFLIDMINQSDIMIVLIGEGWKGNFSHRNNRFDIDEGHDYVRRELEIGLFLLKEKRISILPVFLYPVKCSDFKFPRDFEILSSINGIEFTNKNAKNDIEKLINKIDKLSLPVEEYKTKELKVVDQGIDINQKVTLLGGFREKMPDDCIIEFWKMKGDESWHWKLYSESDNRISKHSMQFRGYASFNRPIQECIGMLSQWYDIVPDRCFEIIESRNKLTNFFNYFLQGKSKYSIKRLPPSYAHHSLLHLVQLIDKEIDYMYHKRNNYNDFMPPKEGEDIEQYITVGYFGENVKSTFGEYICSLTFEVGAKTNESDELIYFPRFPDTKIKYLDVYSPPFFEKIQFIGHVGLNNKGFHIVSLF